MQQQTRQELETLEDMFQHPGWVLLKEDFQKILDAALDRPDQECKTNDEWQFRRGTISELRFFLSYDELVIGLLEDSNVSPV